MSDARDEQQAPQGELDPQGELADYEDAAATEAAGKRRRRMRIASIAGGLVLAVAATLLILNLGAEDANGASKNGAQAAQKDGEAAAAGEDEGEKKGAKDGKNGNGKEKAPVPVRVAEVASGPVSAYLSSTANLVAEDQVKVLSEVEGRVARLPVEEGQRVGRGQVLAALVRDDAEIARNKSALKEENARRAHERGEDLYDKELISREDYDKLAMDFQIARQELAEADWRLQKTTIRSPFAGVISERLIQEGKHVRPGDELFQITDYDPLIARIYLPERDILGLSEGQDVRIRMNADQRVAFAGRIRQISPIVDTATGTVKVTVEAVKPPDEVRPGSFVTIDIVRETHPDALLLPKQAVLRELQKAHVFVANGEVAKKRPVTLGIEEGDRVEVLSGLAAGERVIVAGQGGLKDGSPIKVLEPDGDQPAS